MNRKQREAKLTSKEKKAQRLANRSNNDQYYTVIQNTRTKYTKLVSTSQAFSYVIGRLDPMTGKYVKVHKDTFIEVGYKI